MVYLLLLDQARSNDKPLFTIMNLYREKQQLLHFWNHPCGDIGGIIIRI